jgi:hypothetical protein
MYKRISTSGEEPSLTDDTEREAFLAWRAENSKVGNRGFAKTLYKSLRDTLEKESGLRQRWYLFAVWRRRELEEESTSKDQLKDEVQKRLEEVREQQEKQISNLDAKRLYLDILAIYRQEEKMNPVVKKAEEYLKNPKKGK